MIPDFPSFEHSKLSIKFLGTRGITKEKFCVNIFYVKIYINLCLAGYVVKHSVDDHGFGY